MSRTKLAWLATSVWVLILVSLLWAKLDGLEKLSLNEIGDFLAGATAPLAFLWIIVGYFQQNEELKQNNQALQLQIQELRLSVEQQRELVQVTREDVEMSKEDMRRKEEKEHRDAQPDFRFRVTGSSGGNQASKQNIDINNLGAKATNISFTVTPPLRIHAGAIKFVDSGSKVSFALEVPNNLDNSAYSLLISYIDALGEKQEEKYFAKKGKSGFVEIDHESTHA